MQFQQFGVAALAVAMGSSVQAQTAAPPPGAQITPEQITVQIREQCAYRPIQDNFGLAVARKRFVAADRMVTREIEKEILDHANRVDQCFGELSKVIDQQAATASAPTIAAYRAAVAQQRQGTVADIRAAYASYGFRPSSAAPGPRFGFCRMHDNFDPPKYDDYYNNYYVSDVFIDRDPEAEVADRDEFRPGTRAGQRVLGAMAQWIAPKYKPYTSRDNQYCMFFLTANEAQQALDKEIADDAIKTGVQ